MADSAETGLRVVGSGSALTVGSRRSGLVARGRREAATSPNHPHYDRAIALYQAGNFAAAAAAFQLAAESGHAESQYVLSTLYETGEGVAQDNGAAALWECRAAQQGHSYAQANVSFRCYSAGDFAGAFLWCKRAAAQGLAWAQYNLGLMYRKGEGTDPDDYEAARCFRRAALQGFPEAQAKLGELYATGQGVVQSDTEAVTWYRRAADQGHAESQYQLGHCYAVALGVEHDYVLSRHWIQQAARQGHTRATSELREREYRDP